MAGLKELRGRIEAIKSTEKITSAMKMVAASRLRRAQDVLDKSAAYRDNLYAAAGRTWRFVWRKAEESGRPPELPAIAGAAVRIKNTFWWCFLPTAACAAVTTP